MKRFIFCLLFFPFLVFAQFSQQEMQQFVIKNILPNNGFETNLAGWVGDSGLTLETTASNISSGNAAASFDSTTANHQVYRASNITIPAGLYGHNGVFSCNLKCASGACTHVLEVNDSGGTLVSQSITSSLTYARTSANFIFPSSGTINVAIRAIASNEPQLFFDDCYVSEANNISSVSQSSVVGSAYYPPTAGCDVARTNSLLGAFDTDTDCPGPTIEANVGPGTIATTDANTPTVLTANNLPSGQYIAQVTFYVGINTSTQTGQFQITDGTTPSVATAIDILTTANPMVTVFGYFSYSDPGNRTFELFAASGANTLTLDATSSNRAVRWILYRYPSTQDTVFTADKLANSWSGFHGNDCSWSRTNTALGDPTADASCSFTESVNSNFGTVTSYLSGSDKLPGIVFTPSRSSIYMACANFGFTGGSTGASIGVEISDTDPTTIAYQNHSVLVAGNSQGETLCGLYRATTITPKTIRLRTQSSTSTAIISQNSTKGHSVDWTIFQVDQSFPMPLIANSVTTNSSGVESLQRATITNSGTPAVSSQSGSWISSITDNSTGNMTLNIDSGIFSSVPSCVCSGQNSAAVDEIICMIDKQTTPSTTAIRLYTQNDAGSAQDSDLNVLCIGPK